jgi:hypothetical protein
VAKLSDQADLLVILVWRDDVAVQPAAPLRLCPHRRYLLYVREDGSTWCFCDIPADPAHQHLNDRFDEIRELWEELGRRKHYYARPTDDHCFVCCARIYVRPDGSRTCACDVRHR